MGKTKTAFIGADDANEPSKNKYKKKSDGKKSGKAPGLKGGERLVVMDSDPIINKETSDPTTPEATLGARRRPRVRSKKHKEAVAKIDKSKIYELSEAVELVKDTSYSTFNGSIELHAVLNKEGIKEQVTLPHSTGKAKKIEVASEKTLEKLENNQVDFDILLATADMMPKLVKYARILGPKGMMPNPKNGTIIKKC